MMTIPRPIAPSDNKKFISPEEQLIVEGYVTNLTHIIQAVNPLYKKDALCQPKSLAQLSLQLQLFMDQAFGEQVKNVLLVLITEPTNSYKKSHFIADFNRLALHES